MLPMTLQDLIRDRRSTRYFDPACLISHEDMYRLINRANQAPSSNNSQPWRVVIVTEQHLREKLLPIAYNQQQIMTASAVLILLGDRQAYYADNLNRIHHEEYIAGCFSQEICETLTQAAIEFYEPRSEQEIQKFLGLDCGLWAMTFMLAAQEAGWNTVPMTGYQRAELREMLRLPSRYLDIMMIAVGSGTREGHRTLRHEAERVTVWNAPPSEQP